MNNNEIVIYKSDKLSIKLEVKVENETVWLHLNQISKLFERDKSVISRHISNIFREGELVKESVVAKNATTAKQSKNPRNEERIVAALHLLPKAYSH